MSSVYMQGGPDDLSSVLKGIQESQKVDAVREKEAQIAELESDNQQAQQTDTDSAVAHAFKNSQKKLKADSKLIKKAQEAKEAKKKLVLPENLQNAIKQFKQANPNFQFPAPKELEGMLAKLQEGLTSDEIVELMTQLFLDPLQAILSLEFIVSLSQDPEYIKMIRFIQEIFRKRALETNEKRKQEVKDKMEKDAAQAIAEAGEAALKVLNISKGGAAKEVLEKLHDYYLMNAFDAPTIFKTLDDVYGKNEAHLKKMQMALIKMCGAEVTKLKADLDEREDVAHMKNEMALLKKLQSLRGVSRYFESRNKEEDTARAA